MCGSRLINYFDRNIIQACGGARYFKWLGIQKNIGSGIIQKSKLTEDYVEEHADYIIGASMLFTSDFFKKIGLLNESFFLYFEELDLAERIKGIFKIGYASRSYVYHKEGSSIGTALCQDNQKRYRSEFYVTSSKIKFTKEYYPHALPSVYLALAFIFLKRVLGHDYSRAKAIKDAFLKNWL